MHPKILIFSFPSLIALLKSSSQVTSLFFSVDRHHESRYNPVSLVGLAAGVLRDKSVATPTAVQSLTAYSPYPDLRFFLCPYFVPTFTTVLNILTYTAFNPV